MNFNSRTENNNTDINKQESKLKQSNPILTSDIVSKINNMGTRTTANRFYGGYNQQNWKPAQHTDVMEILRCFNEVIKDKETQNELFYSLHNIFVNKMNAMFTAF